MRFLLLSCLSFTLVLGSCVGPPALHRAVLGYDDIIAQLESEMLLLNIARMEARLPPHFTVATSIAATFNWTAAVGVLGSFREGTGNLGELTLGTSASENPTFSIVPVTGREFTQRFLTPIQDEGFEFVIFQGARIEKSDADTGKWY